MSQHDRESLPKYTSGPLTVCRCHHPSEKPRVLAAMTAPTSTAEPADTISEFSQASALSDRLDNTMLVSGILLSPLYSIQNLPSVAAIPALRAVGLLACMADFTALAVTVSFRIRLKMLNRKGQDERFAEIIAGSFSDRCLANASPMVLIAGSMVLLLVVLSGSLFTSQHALPDLASFGVPEITMLLIGLVLGLTHLGLVMRSVRKTASWHAVHAAQCG